MKVIEPSFTVLTDISEGGMKEIRSIEQAARTCYKSEFNSTDDEAKRFVRKIIERGHEAMLEHSQISVRFICDRGVSHELVRHRLCSFAQESTRYCNYSKDQFGSEITVIKPFFFNDKSEEYDIWYDSCMMAEQSYMDLLSLGVSAQEARTVLPNSLKTEVVMTANYREWRQIFRLRCAHDAHPQMREIMLSLLTYLNDKIPVIFEDIVVEAMPHLILNKEGINKND